MRTICAQRRAELWLIFDCARMMKPRHFQTERLPASPSAKFEYGVIHFLYAEKLRSFRKTRTERQKHGSGRGLLRLAHEAVAPVGAEEVVRALRPSADLRAALDLDLALLRDVAGLVLHVPAERGEERVQELLPQARLVVAGLLVVTEVLLEDAGEPRKLCREGIKRRRGCHARVVNGGGRNVERWHMD